VEHLRDWFISRPKSRHFLRLARSILEHNDAPANAASHFRRGIRCLFAYTPAGLRAPPCLPWWALSGVTTKAEGCGSTLLSRYPTAIQA